MRFNNWTNYETWLVNVWTNPESKSDLEAIKEALEEQYEAMEPGVLKDMIDMTAIDWEELAAPFHGEDDQDND